MDNKIRFKIGEIEFEVEGSLEIIEREREIFLSKLLPIAVEAIIKTKQNSRMSQNVLETVDLTPSSGLTNDNTTAYSGNKISNTNETDWSRISLTSYLTKFGKVNDRDFVLISAYFGEQKTGIKSFTIDAIKQYYSEARRSLYSNVSALLMQLVQKGLIMDDPDSEKKSPKCYVITSEGIDYVTNYQPDEDKKQSKPRKIKTKLKSAYEGINIDDLHLAKYPEISKLSSFKEKMLMVMYIITNENVGEFFSVTDMMYLLTNTFGESATQDQISGVFKREKTWFYAKKSEENAKENKRKLLNNGIIFAKSLIDKQLQNN